MLRDVCILYLAPLGTLQLISLSFEIKELFRMTSYWDQNQTDNMQEKKFNWIGKHYLKATVTG